MLFLLALGSAVLAIAGYRLLDQRVQPQNQNQNTVSYNRLVSSSSSSAGNPDFIRASSMVIPAVVHVNTTYPISNGQGGNPILDLFGLPDNPVPARSAGSGVIITPDGFIVTNNHVIENTATIDVVLPDKRSFKAKLVGRDPSTDLALLKVEGKNLPVVGLGNSDSVQVGEWVLAVGYPYSLNSTVTAGIISAKGRSIGILSRPSQEDYADPGQPVSNSAVEAFLQTDAAINPGNSGGALVNTNGQLIGINAAIASLTGSYAGYGFAIPVNLMQKVIGDLRKYGEVKRGYLGVNFPAPAVEDQILREGGIDPATIKGVYIMGIQAGSGAATAGLKQGDIIKSIDGIQVTSSTELSERIARRHPGDKVQIAYLRNGKLKSAQIELKPEEKPKELALDDKAAKGLQVKLGATFSPLPDRLKQQYGLKSGVYVTDVQQNGFFDSVGIPKGTIITRINGRPVSSLSDINKALGASQTGMVRFEGITPDGTVFVFSFPLGA